MNSIIKNKTQFKFLTKPVEELVRSEVKMPVNNDVLRTYRDVWKMTERFTWCDEDGNSWKDILRTSARKEFE